jgi:hypothetical protein
MTRSLGTFALFATLLAAGGAGCSSSSPDDEEEAPPPTPPQAEVSWQITDGRTLSQISEAAPGVGVYYAAAGGKLELRGVDLSTGEVSWSVETAAIDDAYLAPAPVHGRVGFLAPAPGSSRVRPSVVLAISGRVTSSPTTVGDPNGGGIYACDDVPDFCLYASAPDAATPSLLWIHGARLRVDDYWEAHPDEQGDGLDFEDASVSLRKNGDSVWRQPKAVVLAGASESGWGYYPDPVAGTYEITVSRRGSTPPLAARDIGVISISARTGERLWIRWGVRDTPLALPLPSGEHTGQRGAVALLCAYDGTFGDLFGEPDDRARLVGLIGIDRRTGKQLWRLGRPDECAFPAVETGTAYPRIDGERRELDLATGDATAPADALIVWEASDRRTKVDGATLSEAAVFEPRRNDGSLARPLPWPLPETIGVVHGEIHAFVVGGKVRGYRECTE